MDNFPTPRLLRENSARPSVTGRHSPVPAGTYRHDLVLEGSLEAEPGDVPEDERHPEMNRRGRDPPVHVVTPLPQGMARPLAGDPQIDACVEELGGHDLSACELLLHPTSAARSPVSSPGSVLDLGDRLERD